MSSSPGYSLIDVGFIVSCGIKYGSQQLWPAREATWIGVSHSPLSKRFIAGWPLVLPNAWGGAGGAGAAAAKGAVAVFCPPPNAGPWGPCAAAKTNATTVTTIKTTKN